MSNLLGKRLTMKGTKTKLRSASLIVFFALSVAFAAQAQTEKIDSLRAQLPGKTEAQDIDILFELARECIDVDIELGLRYAHESFAKARVLGDSLKLVKTGRVFAQGLRRASNLESARKIYIEILPVAKRHQFIDEWKIVLNGLGLVHFFLGEYDHALKYNFECLDLKRGAGDVAGVCVTLNNIGLLYMKLRDYDKALTVYKESLRLKNEIKDTFDLDGLLLNIAECYSFKYDFYNALEYVRLGLNTCGSHCSDESLIVAFQTLGYVAYFKKKFAEASIQFLKAYALSQKNGVEHHRLTIIEFLVRIALHNNELKTAEKYLREADALISSGVPYNAEIIQVYHQLQVLYSKYRNYEKAYYYQNKYVLLKDSIHNYELTSNLMKIEAEHVEKENQAKIEAQNKILTLNQEIIFRQKLLNIFIGLIAVLLITVTILLIKSNRQKQRANILLDSRVKERTIALELNKDTLERACQERDLLLEKTSMDIKTSLATMKGLCALSIKEVQDPVALRYIEKIKSTSDKFFETLSRLQLAKEGLKV
jgi:tetratricopeptide (TPR) repeat protein